MIHLAVDIKAQKDNIKLNIHILKENQFIELFNAKYISDKDEQKSVSGGIYTLGGSTIGWTSKLQGRIVLLLMEAVH